MGERGPKPIYEKENASQRGAPYLNTRFDPVKLAWVKGRPEGVRPYLERIVGEDMAREQAEAPAVDDTEN